MRVDIAATWLSTDVLLASVPSEDTDAVHVRVIGQAGVSLETQRFAYDTSTLLMVRFVPPAAERTSMTLSIRTSGGEARLDLEGGMLDLQSLCREKLAPLDGDTRGHLMEFLSGVLDWPHPEPTRVILSRRLLLAREALRERLPFCHAAADGSGRLHADAIVSADQCRFVMTGAMVEFDAPVASLIAVSPEGLRADLLPRLCRHPHRWFPRTTGFTGSFTLGAPSVLDEGWRLELRMAGGDDVEVKAPRVVRELAGARRTLLAALDTAGGPSDLLIHEHVFPCLDLLQSRLRAEVAVESVAQYGTPCASPDVSIVVACGERIDLLEHHLAQFMHDPDMFSADVIYVEDGQASRERLAVRAAHLHQLYRVPFRIATLSHPAGFAAAIDAGSKMALAPLLVMLAPEALPDGPRWLSQLAAFYASTPDAGAVAPTLLAADGAACDLTARATDACLMIERALLDDLGGLCGRYVQGEFEMDDLCRRLIRAGRHVATCSDITFYILREESRLGSQRHVEARYDRWVREHVVDGPLP